ncbi:Hypothetical predicted protein [Cloeon dipterum]|uniref:Oligopeptide transporter 1 n=1 Tax=Cloeon dipterum TaxID=197152 RepID=A0A8S1CIY4_9INSE|nr:Hypothetical predicted protein [Cloeon dipterum]
MSNNENLDPKKGQYYEMEEIDLDKRSPINAEAGKVEKPLKYPKGVWCIIANEFCERFCYYGMRTILALYLVRELSYSEDQATVIFHAFAALSYLTPLLGAILADSWFGKFWTILSLSIVYAAGSVLLSVSAIPNFLPPQTFAIIGLLLIAFGTGGIKPCVSAFGGDQFVLPAQQVQLEKFFSLFYLSINAGSLISTFLTPILREDVQCFEKDCYTLGFGVPAALMVVATIIFVTGKPLYRMTKPEGNIVVKVCKIIGYALVNRCKNSEHQKEHWLDHAKGKYDEKDIADTKLALNALSMFLTVPIFWAIYDQQGSRWTFQATRMNGDVGFYNIKPDQMQVINPFLILALIPIFNFTLYPLFEKIKICNKPLGKMCLGGILAAVAFLISAFLDWRILQSGGVMPKAGQAQLRIYNTMNCSVIISADGAVKIDGHEIGSLDLWENLHIAAQGNQSFQLSAKPGPTCRDQQEMTYDLTIEEKTAQSFAILGGFENVRMNLSERYIDSPEKSSHGKGKVRVILNAVHNKTFPVTFNGTQLKIINIQPNTPVSKIAEIEPGSYDITPIGIESNKKFVIKAGGVYTYLLNGETRQVVETIITPENRISLLWQLPQYIVITTAEILFSVTGLEFSFTQAPVSMKSVIMAGWLIAVTVGNIIVIFVAEAQIFEEQMWEYVLFAGIMLAAMAIFNIQARYFKYVENDKEEEK